MATKVYSVKSNAKRDMKRLGLPDASTLRAVKGGWTFDGAPEVKGKPAKAAKAPKPKKKVKAAKPAKVTGVKAASGTTKHGVGSKPALVMEMIGAKGGASVEALLTATGWKPPTLRGFLSRKVTDEKMPVQRTRTDGVTRYSLA